MANRNLKDAPFGLAQAPAYFQRLVNEVLSGFTFAFGYLDDILVFSPDMKSHLEHLRLLFERLRTTDLTLKEAECKLSQKTYPIPWTYCVGGRHNTTSRKT